MLRSNTLIMNISLNKQQHLHFECLSINTSMKMAYKTNKMLGRKKRKYFITTKIITSFHIKKSFYTHGNIFRKTKQTMEHLNLEEIIWIQNQIPIQKTEKKKHQITWYIFIYTSIGTS